ncbi:zf-RING_2 domain-containing protein [Cephalotus follicularis]|uniref:RING-type E3 ubiquitin transferase n=1 Tax=Cephalotus follicularis TaxID=3775 RepID=A0A1Q3C6U3_CEPFO|nr:zf-RING_2 domain-containing protein [Cephalotus follicularis]
MLTAVVSLSFVIMVVVALHMYARCILRRQARRREALRSLGLTVAHARSSEPPKTGLNPMIIASLPTFTVKQTNSQDDATIIECSVCLSMLEDQEIARLLPNCKHTFHKDCIDKWLSSHSSCPICRADAEPRPQPEPREGPVAGKAPKPLLVERVNPTTVLVSAEGASSYGGVQSPKVDSPNTRLSSFRRILSRETSSNRLQSRGQDDGTVDLERQ